MSDDPVAKKARVGAAAEADDAPEGAAKSADVPNGEAGLANGGEGEHELLTEGDEDAERLDQAIAGLVAVQNELEQVNDEASMKVLEVEMEYNRRRKPVYERRSRLIKDVEHFWLSVFLQHPHTSSCLRQDDTEAMACLEEVDITDLPDIKSGFTVTFRFMEGNTLFANRELRKEYRFMEDGMLMVTGTEIDWLVVLAQEEDPLPSGRCVVEQGESFFAWFDPPEQGMPMALDIDGTAEALKDDIWPNPMKFYTGEMGLPPVSPVAPGVNQGFPGNPIWLRDDEEDEDFEGDDEYDVQGDYTERFPQHGEPAVEDEDEEADVLADDGAALDAEYASAEAQEEEDAEVEFMDPGIGTGGAHGAGGSGDAQAAPEEEEYYDDEGADHDREDDEE